MPEHGKVLEFVRKILSAKKDSKSILNLFEELESQIKNQQTTLERLNDIKRYADNYETVRKSKMITQKNFSYQIINVRRNVS
jgi:uncharacterized membrane protein YgaE (UPF0421/DUF939 family)